MRTGKASARMLAALGVFAICGTGGFAYAQFNFTNISADLALSSVPEYPAPNSSVRVSARSLLIDLRASELTWYVNGAVAAEGVGVAELTVATGPLGSETQIRVEARSAERNASAQGVLRPTEVDLLWEGDSYVPPFYRGRALPTAGGNVRLFAVPRLQRANAASFISPDELIYTWRKNNRIVEEASGRGKHTVVVSAPALFGADTVSVEVRTADNALRGFASARILSSEPTLLFYQEHPIFGILYHRAIGSGAVIPETEATFAAIPYFAPVRSLSEAPLRYAWRVNNTSVAGNPDRPNAITLNAEGTDGRAFVELALTHATNFFLRARDSWNITLSGSGGSVFTDPFR